jgi:precorrin-8X/cobalt-precorrin-8 methylmutase
MNQHGILILGHGSPSAEGTRSFLEIVKLVESMAGDTPVAAGFMEFASPTIVEGAAALHRRGVDRIAAVPVFLSGVGHTANDIPPAVDAARETLKDSQIRLTRHVGSHLKVVELSALRYKEAIVGRSEIPAEETLAVIAAHGSPEPEAFEEFERFALARQKLTPVWQLVPCFSQMGAPLLKDVLPTLITPNIRRIVVQPHFLLKGRLIDTIAETTATVAKQHPEIDWIITEPLGCHRLLAEAVLELGTAIQ